MARNLYYGCTGSDVSTLQKNLKTLGYYKTGKVDGIFGPLTDAAVRQLQNANGLAVDGIVGPITRSCIAGLLKKKKGKTVKKPKKKKKKSKSTHVMGRWNGHEFIVSPSLIRGFTDLHIKNSSELKDRKESGQGKVARKGANPSEVTLTIHLSAHTGCSVRSEALKFLSEANNGNSDYFYVAGKKLLTHQLMLTEATVQNVELTQGGKWVAAEVLLTMKRSTY